MPEVTATKPRMSAGKPWSLRGREAEIANLRDGLGQSWELIAVQMGASKQGVIDAYNRFQKEKAAHPATETRPTLSSTPEGASRMNVPQGALPSEEAKPPQEG